MWARLDGYGDGDTDELHCLEVWDILTSDEGCTDESDYDTDQFQSDLNLYERDVDGNMGYVFGDVTIDSSYYRNYTLVFSLLYTIIYLIHLT